MKTRVRVHEYPDGTRAALLGPHRLADYTAEGVLVSPDTLEPGRVLGAVKDEPLAGHLLSRCIRHAEPLPIRARSPGTSHMSCDRTC